MEPVKPDEKTLLDNLGKIAYTLDKAYLTRLAADYGVLCYEEKYNRNGMICYENNIRAIRVERWVFDKEESPGECFKNVLNLFADGDHTIALVVKRKMTVSEMYFVVKNEGLGRNEDSGSNLSSLESAVKGNFPGTYTKRLSVSETKETFDFSGNRSIAVMANIPSEFSEKHITQGLEKVLNGIVPGSREEEYTVLFTAESLTWADIREILSGYEDIATAIAPFAQYQFRTGKNQVDTHGEMKSVSNSHSISESVFKTHSVNVGVNGSVNRISPGSETTDIRGLIPKVLNMGGEIIGGFVGGPAGAFLGRKVGDVIGAAVPSGSNQTGGGAGVGLSAGYGYSWGESKTVSNGSTDTTGTSSSISVGQSEDTTYTYKSYMVANMLEKLEKTMKRIEESQGTGLWKYAAYVISDDAKISKNVAGYLRAVTQGKESFMEPAFVQEWSHEDSNGATPFHEIIQYVSHFTHPVFVSLKMGGDAMLVTPTSYVATNELGYVISFPRKSVQGLPVLEGVQFGREPHSLQPARADLQLGCGYHMHEKITSQRIALTKQELTKHTFITGSTGAGKSNTIYRLLESLAQQHVKFLVIEPAKGEYKTVIGKKKGVTTYGTNPNRNDTKLLRLNPFRFPEGTHILEHLDRLVELFNVCWPMYAAMPAILKDSMERAYQESGWNLVRSENRYDNNLFPTFADVVTQIKLVLEESEYSADNKGDYTGSLVTRLKSLTNGINGLIFSTDDLTDEELFDRNVIIDLSRVGSTETKALIMGLLILKLQEHRMENAEPDAALHHVTVLEEAHNLLKRTSTEQSDEGSDLLGRSVEMLANAIAEMRTYGEGFIIADQSPGLLDMSVIRNTNTKIIMRLPDISDRELVGKAAGLNDYQINELARLENGVASITQSEWLEPVLCKIDRYEGRDEVFSFIDSDPKRNATQRTDVRESLLECIMNREIYRKGDRVDIRKLRSAVLRSGLETKVKCDFLEYISSDDGEAVEKLRALLYDFFHAGKVMDSLKKIKDRNQWINFVVDSLEPSVKGYSNRQINLLLAFILNEQALRDPEYDNVFFRFIELYRKERRVY